MKKQTVEERRADILEVTCQVIIERGFAATRISDVAKRLEVSSSLIHYHFDSKEQLLAEAFAHYARNDLADMEAEIASVPTAIGQLDRIIQNYVPEGSDDVEWMLWIDGWGEALRNPMMKTISQELDEQTADLLARVIANGVDSGEFACVSARATATRLTALVDGLAVQFAAHDGLMNRSQLIDHVRTVAAAEVGLTIDDFDGVPIVRTVVGSKAPGVATEAALRRLISQYGDAIIRNDHESLSSLFTDDAVWDPGSGTPAKGLDEIGATFVTLLRGTQWAVPSVLVSIFEVDEASGTGTGRVTVEQRSKTKRGETVTLLGTFHDEYVRSGGEWLFGKRSMTVIDRS